MSGEHKLFELLDEFMGLYENGFGSQAPRVASKWSQFKELIAQRPINYHQVFIFISKMQDEEKESKGEEEEGFKESDKQQEQQLSSQNGRLNNFRNSSGKMPHNNYTSSSSSINQNHFQSNFSQNSGDISVQAHLGMFKTTAGNIQAHMINSRKQEAQQSVEVQSRSSTRDQFQQNVNAHASQQKPGTFQVNNQNPLSNNQIPSRTNHRANLNSHSSSKRENSNSKYNSQGNQDNQLIAPPNKNGFNIHQQSSSQCEEGQEQLSLHQSPDKFHSVSKKAQYLNSVIPSLQQSTNNQVGITNNSNTSNNFNSQAESYINKTPNYNKNGETSTFVRDESVYSCIQFSDFLRENTKIQSLGRNTQFESTSVLQLSNSSNSVLKIISISYFMYLINELPHPEVSESQTCVNSKGILLDIFYKVSNNKIRLNVNNVNNSVFSSEQITSSFVQHMGFILQLSLLHGLNPQKLTRAFLHFIQYDPLFFDSIVTTVKEILFEYIENSENEVIHQLFLSNNTSSNQQNKQQQKINEGEVKEEKKRVLTKMRQIQNWRDVKHEWLFLLSLALQRPIEFFNLKDNKLEQILFKSKKMHVSEVVDSNKINIITVTKLDQKHSTTFLLLNKPHELQLYQQINLPFKKQDLKLDDELNLQYLSKQILKFKNNGTLPIEHEKSKQQDYDSNSNTTSNSKESANLKSPENKIPNFNVNSNFPNHSLSSDSYSKDQFLANRNSKLALHLNSAQIVSQGNTQIHQQQQNSNHLPQNQSHYNNLQQNNVEDQPQQRKSHSIQQQPLQISTNPNFTSPTPSNNQQASSPRLQNAPATGVGGIINTSPPPPKLASRQGQLDSLPNNKFQFQKSSALPPNYQKQDEWGRTGMFAKVKDLLFTLNINSDQLNSMARFPHSSMSKENIQPKSPLKYKQVLYPLPSSGSPHIQQLPVSSFENTGSSNVPSQTSTKNASSTGSSLSSAGASIPNSTTNNNNNLMPKFSNQFNSLNNNGSSQMSQYPNINSSQTNGNNVATNLLGQGKSSNPLYPTGSNNFSNNSGTFQGISSGNSFKRINNLETAQYQPQPSVMPTQIQSLMQQQPPQIQQSSQLQQQREILNKLSPRNILNAPY